LVLTFVGGVAGLGLAWALVSMGDPTSGSFPVFYLPTSNLLVGFILIVVMAFIAGIIPALQAQRLQIADALRR
jgi:putative ABC transport system permease protein